jgi:hypothetical protein
VDLVNETTTVEVRYAYDPKRVPDRKNALSGSSR